MPFRNPPALYMTKLMGGYLSEKLNVGEINWHFSEIAHGKGVPDGVGAALTRTVDGLVAHQIHIPDCDMLIPLLQQHCKGITYGLHRYRSTKVLAGVFAIWCYGLALAEIPHPVVAGRRPMRLNASDLPTGGRGCSQAPSSYWQLLLAEHYYRELFRIRGARPILFNGTPHTMPFKKSKGQLTSMPSSSLYWLPRLWTDRRNETALPYPGTLNRPLRIPIYCLSVPHPYHQDYHLVLQGLVRRTEIRNGIADPSKNLQYHVGRHSITNPQPGVSTTCSSLRPAAVQPAEAKLSKPGWGKWEILKKPCRPAALSSKIPTFENKRTTPYGIPDHSDERKLFDHYNRQPLMTRINANMESNSKGILKVMRGIILPLAPAVEEKHYGTFANSLFLEAGKTLQTYPKSNMKCKLKRSHPLHNNKLKLGQASSRSSQLLYFVRCSRAICIRHKSSKNEDISEMFKKLFPLQSSHKQAKEITSLIAKKICNDFVSFSFVEPTSLYMTQINFSDNLNNFDGRRDIVFSTHQGFQDKSFLNFTLICNTSAVRQIYFTSGKLWVFGIKLPLHYQ
ncbi:hypothetical protein PR048_002944 [Dryococelus australis]|uniref:Uncharacterized protein n=1 Tax=Dryococelus australis TaxID=614101 RepID=A0ABQ9IN56_9NEOP|nr:hypothetical protein PR048_002944 [Dryococelus australis]